MAPYVRFYIKFLLIKQLNLPYYGYNRLPELKSFLLLCGTKFSDYHKLKENPHMKEKLYTIPLMGRLQGG